MGEYEGVVKQILLILAVVALVGCGTTPAKTPDKKPFIANPIVEKADKKPLTEEESAKIIERAVRRQLPFQPNVSPKQRPPEPTGELTKADFEKVTRLHLSNNQLTEVPKGLEKLTKLTYLNFDGNQLTSVKGLENLNQLTSLNIRSNKLTELPKGLEKLTQLRQLFLAYNQLTDVKGLEKLTQLRNLTLYNNPGLTYAQFAQLQKALPRCRILWGQDRSVYIFQFAPK